MNRRPQAVRRAPWKRRLPGWRVWAEDIAAGLLLAVGLFVFFFLFLLIAP